MAKYPVLKTFRDKNTSQLVLAGSFFETDDKKRLDYMVERGLLKSEEKPTTVKEPVKKATIRKKSGE